MTDAGMVDAGMADAGITAAVHYSAGIIDALAKPKPPLLEGRLVSRRIA